MTGLQGSVDISAIPIAAIDHVEIITDGASALYGSDAVGGVVNFILKKDHSGADTGAEVGYPTNSAYSQLLGLAGLRVPPRSRISIATSRASMAINATGGPARIPIQLLDPFMAPSSMVDPTRGVSYFTEGSTDSESFGPSLRSSSSFRAAGRVVPAGAQRGLRPHSPWRSLRSVAISART